MRDRKGPEGFIAVENGVQHTNLIPLTNVEFLILKCCAESGRKNCDETSVMN